MAKTKSSSSTKKVAAKKGMTAKKGLKSKAAVKSPKGSGKKKGGKQPSNKQPSNKKGAANLKGPVTLEEAQAILSKAAPTKAALKASATRSATLPDVKETLATIGEERDRLDKEYDQESARRIREYSALIKLMKERGVKESAVTTRAARELGGPAAAARAITPLQAFAEGDSWFDYPYPFFGGGVIPRLQVMLGVPILNLARAGDEVRNMLGVTERQIIEKQLRNGSPTGDTWDVMLFSGGGNDIVGNPLALWVRDYDPSVPLPDLLHSSRFDTVMGLVRAGYEDLITMRNKLSPTTHLVFHAYDFAIPNGTGVCGMGPWLKPAFDVRKFPNQSSAFEVVKEMLKRFALMLDHLALANARVTFINAQGTLNANSWHNELHPSSSGFQSIANVFKNKLKQLFPTKVP